MNDPIMELLAITNDSEIRNKLYQWSKKYIRKYGYRASRLEMPGDEEYALNQTTCALRNLGIQVANEQAITSQSRDRENDHIHTTFILSVLKMK